MDNMCMMFRGSSVPNLGVTDICFQGWAVSGLSVSRMRVTVETLAYIQTLSAASKSSALTFFSDITTLPGFSTAAFCV
jgi:hypothetical protein